MVEQGYVLKHSIYEHQIWRGKRPTLSSLDIELTERCNNACLHCYINLLQNDQ
jgi:MoaA/NifB/PqqE/SkfB family radical SAM enzyme